jgi:hypothetical protein
MVCLTILVILLPVPTYQLSKPCYPVTQQKTVIRLHQLSTELDAQYLYARITGGGKCRMIGSPHRTQTIFTQLTNIKLNSSDQNLPHNLLCHQKKLYEAAHFILLPSVQNKPTSACTVVRHGILVLDQSW